MSREAFEPLVEELPASTEAAPVFARLSVLPHCLFLDSALRHPRLGRYSFVAADPFQFLTAAPKTDALGQLAGEIARYPTPTIPGLPPFQGGAAGVFGYDLGRQLERLPRPRNDEFGVPLLAVGFYDVVVAFDHEVGRSWIISTGWPEGTIDGRARRASDRLRQIRNVVEGHRPASPGASRPSCPPVPRSELAPQYPVGRLSNVTSNFSRTGYLAAVGRAIDYICAGDVFQVNLAQRLLHPALDDSVSLYHRLRQRNAAPFAAYFDLGHFQIASASPERFLAVRDRGVETRPIKGTRRRASQDFRDAEQAGQLLASEKDRAENVMIVDLLRNDLSRVCEAESVCVTELCALERYAYVQHLVSAVRGRLRDDKSCVDLIRAAFPGGSITGAPKIRAMEIIAELEPTARGPYCGSLGYLGFDGAMDLSILIRTITAGRGWWQAPVGGGIVAQSDPDAEYAETWQKAEGMLRAFRS